MWKSSLCLFKILNDALQSLFSAPITHAYLAQVMMQQKWLQLWTRVHTMGVGEGAGLISSAEKPEQSVGFKLVINSCTVR